MMLTDLCTETIKTFRLLRGTKYGGCEMNASDYRVYPVTRFTGEGRAGFSAGGGEWGGVIHVLFLVRRL